MEESQILTQTYEEVRQRFAGIDDLAHGWEHVQRVYSYDPIPGGAGGGGSLCGRDGRAYA